jgi:hypothetical protein
VTIIGTAEVKGTPEPCGCNSDPLGDIARVVPLAKGGLLLDAGSLLYESAVAGAAGSQADLKAAKLAQIYGGAGADVGLGALDLVRGPVAVSPPRQCANGTTLATVPPHVRVINGVKVGVFGVVKPERAPEAKAGDPVAASRQAVAQLQKDGAQVIVGLLGMSRAEARDLMNAVEGIGFGLIGADVGEGMAEPEPVKNGFLVAPADVLRRVVRIELHAKNGQVALQPFAGEAARQLELARTDRRIRTLTLELAGWKNDPNADKTFVAAREDELKQLQAKKQQLEKTHPEPPTTSYFTYALQPVNVALPRDGKVADALRQLAREIGQTNLAAARSVPPPPAEPGKPHYVGMDACGGCHKSEVEFWKHTVHAHAWKSLVDVDKQYNYDCIGCHVTGWDKPGGSNLGSVEKQKLVNVQCEVCHGPGSTHVAEDGLETPKTMRRAPGDDLCATQCHTKEHSDTFALTPYLRDIVGKGHGEKLRQALGDGVTGHELRQKALATARGK